ncbi:aminomethyl-transferring glycine dehydrogenase [Swingsia samuiensis]|uniref:Glycine dehydrogenase (decarboxylating) n=1 Tax=Swingsia samuiensis TaxID=1293412 RepID=A0A4Y6UIP0_9PROT|nr:aminomethyl-transferring glycine dehydrogenase [Swingsia samuiensis]QDH16934.1 aminomethyl-transferring glycine dehydrogenase [Swingsia samuiensis]
MTNLWPEVNERFSSRHVGPRTSEIAEMLSVVGASSLDDLIDRTIPRTILDKNDYGIGAPLTEQEALARLKKIASRNQVFTSMIGQGYYDTILPTVIQRNILENPAWYTAYTPYQPEISQGRLEALLNFQTLVSDLTGLDIANASLLDEGTACAEAMALAKRVGKSKSNIFFVDQDTHPQTISVLKTRAEPLGWDIKVGDPKSDLLEEDVFGVLLSYPGSSGKVWDPKELIEKLHTKNVIVTLTCDPLALVLLDSPGNLGADIAVGSMQRYGVPMGAGGPHAAFMATREVYKRSIPGRLVGISRDRSGKQAYRLALQTREQHIRREKATSNICTAQVLLAIIASMYAVYHGPQGLRAIAQRVNRLSSILAAGLRDLGFQIGSDNFFDTITINAGSLAQQIKKKTLEAKINIRELEHGYFAISCDETTEPETIRTLWRCFGATEEQIKKFEQSLSIVESLPSDLLRKGDFLNHSVFHEHHSETDLLRYMRALSDKDLALDRTMIPLGSCTMKLNATTEMMPITWPEFGRIHPFAPEEQKEGYSELFAYLEDALCKISGYDAVSLQPNSGAQGEFAGLIAIREYYAAKGDVQRDVCLIPASAHGTNPASAHMAGMRVVVVACDDNGNVDVADLREKISQNEGRIAAIMITYPSTHGVFEERIVEICDLVHEAGGQVYLDGANLNAQVGFARPGQYGADVSHFNLHKTFCIPHGGGGPGMGPIGVRQHLAPYLPREGGGTISSAPYGSASILPISVAYIMMMGDEGLRQATAVAVLNANYIAARLDGAYSVLYRGENGFTAHECIIDLRPLKDKAGVSVDDIAKRLIDHGFHAPTVSFPVAGTFMIEPTESEGKKELDRFCEAMISIRHEITEIEKGEMALDESPLHFAPHTIADIAGEWARAYPREKGAFPQGVEVIKYWPPVGRLDNAWGDRNLICSCPDISQYMEE